MKTTTPTTTTICETCGERYTYCPYAADVFCRCDLDASQTEAQAAIDAECDRLATEPAAIACDEGGFEDCPW